MEIFQATIHVGLGDLIYIRAQMDGVKHKYEQIKLSFNKDIIEGHRGISYYQFVKDVGQLLFSDPPYVITEENYPHLSLVDLANCHGMTPVKPELKDVLCKGEPLNIASEYIVLTTKVRYFYKSVYQNHYNEFWDLIKLLSNKYKIVILGEKIVEMNSEYQIYGSNEIFTIYDDIIKNISHEKLLDLTVPALGITPPNLDKIRQDCLIMNKSKVVITLGVGGSFCMATAVANTVGYRIDQDPIADVVFRNIYPDAFVTKDWNSFVKKMKEYL